MLEYYSVCIEALSQELSAEQIALSSTQTELSIKQSDLSNATQSTSELNSRLVCVVKGSKLIETEESTIRSERDHSPIQSRGVELESENEELRSANIQYAKEAREHQLYLCDQQRSNVALHSALQRTEKALEDRKEKVAQQRKVLHLQGELIRDSSASE